jgi:hypothetical protein
MGVRKTRLRVSIAMAGRRPGFALSSFAVAGRRQRAEDRKTE